MLESANVTIQGIGDTTTDRIGNVIAQGLADGSPVATITAGIGDYIGNPDRAFTIAQTETSRAMISSQASEYAALGFAQFEWLAYDGACDECLDQEDANPHDLGDDQPPGHPSCRCSIVGTGDVTTPEGALDYQGDGFTPPSDAAGVETMDTSGSTSVVSALFQSWQDARAFFEGNNIVFNEAGLKSIGATPEILQDVADAITTAEAKTPGVIDELEAIGKTEGRASKGEMASIAKSTENGKVVGGSRIQLTKAVCELAKRDDVNELLTNSDQVTARSIKDLFIHEMGHVIQNMAQDTSISWRAADDEMKAAISQAIKDAGANLKSPAGRKWITENVSSYALKTPLELHSELQVIIGDAERMASLPDDVRSVFLAYQDSLNTYYGMDFVKMLDKAATTTDVRTIVDTFGLEDLLERLGISND